MVKNIIFLTLIFILNGCGMMGSSSNRDTSLYDTESSSSVAITDVNLSNSESNLVADNSINNSPDAEPTIQEESILPETISIDFPDILKQDTVREENISNDIDESSESISDTVEDNQTIESNDENITIAEIGYEQLKKNISRIEDVVKIAQVNLILLEKVMPQVLDKCEGMISCTFEPKYLSVKLDSETISKIDEIVDDKNFTLADKDSRVSLGEIAFSKKSVYEGYDYELKLDMLSDDIKLNNLYKDMNKTESNSSIDEELDIDENLTDINTSGTFFEINTTQDINITDSNLSENIETNITTLDDNISEINLTKDIEAIEDINSSKIEEVLESEDINDTKMEEVLESEDINDTKIEEVIETEDILEEDVNSTIVEQEDIKDINETDKSVEDNSTSEDKTNLKDMNVAIQEYQIFKWSNYNRDVITTYVYDNNNSIINISIYYLVDEYGKETMHIYNTSNKDGYKENMNLTLANSEDDNSTLALQANSIEQSFDGNETNISSFSSTGEISDESSLILFSGTVSNDNEENNISNSSEVICNGNSNCNESNSTVDEIPEIQTNLEFYELKITDGNLTDGSFVLLPPYTDINGLTLIDIFGLTLGTFTVSNGKAQGEIHNSSYNDMLDRLTIVEIDESKESKTKFRLISSEDRPNIELIEP